MPVARRIVKSVSCFKRIDHETFFPKAAAKGSFKKSAEIKDCHQTSPKVLLK